MVHKHGRRWAPKDKLFAMSIMYQSRKACKLLQKIFTLPSQRTLQRDLQRCNVYPGFNATIFRTLAVKVKHMAPKETDCVLVFDEIALKTKFVCNRERDCDKTLCYVLLIDAGQQMGLKCSRVVAMFFLHY